MKTTLPKLTLRSDELDEHAMVPILAGFCEVFSDYCLLRKETSKYQKMARTMACVLLDTQAVTPTTLTFVATAPHTMQLVRLLPWQVATLSREEANEIVERFAHCFARFCRDLVPKNTIDLTCVPLPAEGGQTV
jgi:hypothetical protein